MSDRRINLSCGLCERPVTGVHYLWDNLNGTETTVWFHGPEPEDQCFMYKGSTSPKDDVLPGKSLLTE